MSDQRPIKFRAVASETDPDMLDVKQTLRRAKIASEHFADIERTVSGQKRVEDPGGDQFMKVSWKEFLDIRQDERFIPMSKYIMNLMFYADGQKPRPKPLRPLIRNEVGMWTNARGEQKIVFLKDAGPDDVGEGKYYHVSGVDFSKSGTTLDEADSTKVASMLQTGTLEVLSPEPVIVVETEAPDGTD